MSRNLCKFKKYKEWIIIGNLNTIDLEDVFTTRQWFYDFLGKSFYEEPNQTRLKEAFNINIFESFKGQDDESQSEGVDLVLSSLKDIETMEEKDFKKIKEEYNRLFVGPGKLVAPPWGSVYLSEERIIFDEHTLSVRDFYKSWGISVNRKNKEPDDHIGFELEFMSIMCRKSIDAIRENDMDKLKDLLEAQKSFLQDHLLKWTDQFFQVIFKYSEENFFKGLALFTSEYLNMDKELLEDIKRNII